ncbi:SEC-C domain-containing protein [Bacillus paramycoides]|uniref:SEC-C domain-containing protein n=1 Tax=Bacillus paramycoides TaxID=2026194 RepID=UPI002E21A741|nr:SEC-C domain-containing protein [Bacillus paramycoides]
MMNINDMYEIEKMKFEPYESCPCGSDQKFKFCCYQKAREAKYTQHDRIDYSDSRLNHIMNKSWENTDFKTCFAFDKERCEELIKGAHSIQNNRILNRVSDDGHVYHIRGEVEKSELKPVFKKLSRNKASTFFGFCNFHDTELFKPIEQKEYNQESIQNFLFAFRALTLHYHNKNRELNLLQNHFKEFPDSMLNGQDVYGYRQALLSISDCAKQYEIFNNNYMESNFEKIRTIYRKIDFEVNFASSASFAVRKDLKGNTINEVYTNKKTEKMPLIFITIYPIENGTNILLSYHQDDDVIYHEYFEQLKRLPISDLLKHLNFLLIEYTENIFFKPSWIESMEDKQKQSILGSFESSMDLDRKMDLILSDNYYKFDLFNDKSTF